MPIAPQGQTSSPAAPPETSPPFGKAPLVLAVAGALGVASAFVLHGPAQVVAFYGGFLALPLALVLGVANATSSSGGRLTLRPTTGLGWTAAALLVLGLVMFVAAGFVDTTTKTASNLQNAAMQYGLGLAALSVVPMLLGVFRRSERSLPVIVLSGLIGFVYTFLVVGFSLSGG